MIVVTFEDVLAPARSGFAWTQVKVDESATSTGPWTLIDTLALSPLDSDPGQPKPRRITTENAILAAGWYRLTFVDAAAASSLPTAAIQNVPSVDSETRPTVHELSSLMRARLKTEFSSDNDAFNADTVPTADEADGLIDLAVDGVRIKLGDAIPPLYWKHCRTAILFKAAALVEITYYPEQANSDNSAYALYQDQYNEIVATLVHALQGDTATHPARLVSVPMVGSRGYVPLTLGLNLRYGNLDELLA